MKTAAIGCLAVTAAAFLSCGPAMGETPDRGIDVCVQLGEQPYFIGESMPVSVIVTNRNSGQGSGAFFYHHTGDKRLNRSGVIMNLIHVESGDQLVQRRKMGNGYSSVGPSGYSRLTGDLEKLFTIIKTGKYRLGVCIVDYDELGSAVSGKVVYASTKKLDIQSLPMEFEVRGVDTELAARVDLLLKSVKRREIMEGLALLATARAELFRRAASALPPLFRSRDALVRAAALRVLLARVELTGAFSDAELYEALDTASREPDEAIRLAAAKAVPRAGRDLARGRILRTFIDKRMGPWIEGEASEDCRTCLVTENALKLDVMAKIIRDDRSPQVRAAAVRRLSDFAPGNLLKVADSFGKLSGEVEMDGKRQPLAAFVAEECARVQARIDQAEGKGNVPLQAPAR